MAIQVFVSKFHVDECLNEIKECLDKGWPGMGFKTIEFEKKWKEYTGLENAHFLNSATAGLHLAVKLLKRKYGWKDGDEVISTPLTFVSSNHAMLYENLNVVFADIDQYLCLDPEDVEKKITDKTRAVMFVGFGGSTGQYKKIVDICKRHNLALILDAAHLAGTKLDGDTPGKEADAVVYSFQAVKNLPTADSGMVCFKDKELDDLCRKIAWMGINQDTFKRMAGGSYKWQYSVDDIGYKYHGNSIMASLALVQLKYLEEDNSYRRTLAHLYSKRFAGTSIKTIPVPECCLTSRHLYVINVDNRNELIDHLKKYEINPSVHYILNTEFPMYSKYKGTCKNAEYMAKRILTLPLHLNMTVDDVNLVADKTLEFLNETKPGNR
ncbi:MAG TPA: DegT/DnrJ/EryC1/StrS family aminotransferase [Methanofastidiosum sp.]|nr:DegT/DnrJ/EryC1/StrS family aminotransferase [Methanofastidiosum sp.]